MTSISREERVEYPVPRKLVLAIDAIRTQLHEHVGNRPDCVYCRIADHVNAAFGEAVGEPLSPDEALRAEVLRLVDALEYAHSEGFNWPSDPLPLGSIAHNLFIERGNDPERIAAKAERP